MRRLKVIFKDVINAICKPVSRIIRIKIIREANNIQCLVELGDIEAARNVKQRLNGCDIYSGCCTLKIEYSKVISSETNYFVIL